MPTDLLEQIQKLSADQIAAQLARLSEDERTLRTLLRSARAKERAARQQGTAQTTRGSRRG